MGANTRPSHRQWVRRNLPDSDVTSCVHCRHPIRHYPYVDWVDISDAFHGGTYDMCLHNRQGGDHRPSS